MNANHDGVSIRPAEISDAGDIAHVQIETWHSTYKGIVPDGHLRSLSHDQGTERWRHILTRASENAGTGRFTLVAETGDTIIGFVSGGPERDGIDGFPGEIYALYIERASQGRGLGQMLMERGAERLRAADLGRFLVWVLTDNPYAEFYRKLGGIEIGRKNLVIGGKELEETAYGWSHGIAADAKRF